MNLKKSGLKKMENQDFLHGFLLLRRVLRTQCSSSVYFFLHGDIDIEQWHCHVHIKIHIKLLTQRSKIKRRPKKKKETPSRIRNFFPCRVLPFHVPFLLPPLPLERISAHSPCHSHPARYPVQSPIPHPPSPRAHLPSASPPPPPTCWLLYATPPLNHH